MEEFTLAPQPALPYSAYCLSLPLISVCTGCGSVSAANLQLPQHVMDKFRNLALIECIPVYRLLANGPIRQPLARLLHEVENHGTFAKTNIFIADFRRSPAPRFPASKRAANQARVPAGVNTSHRNVVPPYGYVVIHKEIRSLRVADLPQSLGRQRLLDCRTDTLANDFVVGACASTGASTAWRTGSSCPRCCSSWRSSSCPS